MEYSRSWSVLFLCLVVPNNPNYLGSQYPNATGHNDGKDEQMPVEGVLCRQFRWHMLTACLESGNMVIMALSYAQRTGDYSQVQRYVCIYLSVTLLPLTRLKVGFARPMDSISDYRFAYSRKSDQHGRLCRSPCEPDQSGY